MSKLLIFLAIIGKRQVAGLTVLVSLCVTANSCAYRLTNLHMRNPNKIQSIAIEGIYNTGSEPIPHDQVWDQLQRAFAANGHLKIASVGKSDALLRAKISNTRYSRSGALDDTQSGSDRSDPPLYPVTGNPLAPNKLPDINTARKYFQKDLLTFNLEVEVYDMSTKAILLQRTYSLAVDTLAIRSDANAVAFLRHEESVQYGIAKSARSVADNIISDLLVR
ncbi:MAG: hypothetical protein NT027_08650 [Proteobacteria bacterium]|nr:hypothetical protein [Pseudomonadota bacterium]